MDFSKIIKMNPKQQSFSRRIILKLEHQLLKHSQVGTPAFFENKLFPWVSEIEQNIPQLQQEMQVIMARVHDLPNFHEISEEQKFISSDSKWRIFPFFVYGVSNPELEKTCPHTMEILKKVPGIKSAMYSILFPNLYIPPHRGPYRGLLRLHIPLKIPINYQDCKIEIQNQTRFWEEGKCLIFDDCYSHQVWNNTNEIRVVIFVDFLRPLGFPWHQLNKSIVKLYSKSAYIRNPAKNILRWYHEKWKSV